MKIFSANTNTIPISFSGEFRLKEIDGINCAYCAQPMLARKTIHQTFSPNGHTSRLLLDRAKDIRPFFRPFQRNVLDFLINLRRKYDLKSDDDVMAKAKSITSRVVETDLKDKLDKIQAVIDNTYLQSLRDRMAETKDDFRESLSRRRRYHDLPKFVFSPYGLHIRKWDKSPTALKIKDIVKDMDKPEYSMYGYILDKIRINSPEDFYKGLALEAEPTMEHVHPRSQNGANNMSNYLLVCRKCNSERKNTDLQEYYRQHPEIKRNIDEQLKQLEKDIPQLVRDNKLTKEYLDYPYLARRVVAEASHDTLGYNQIFIHAK